MEIPNALRDFFQNTPIINNDPSHLLCQAAASQESTISNVHYANSVSKHFGRHSEWAAYLLCTKCNHTWLVCPQCCVTINSTKAEMLNRHSRTKFHQGRMAVASSSVANVAVSLTDANMNHQAMHHYNNGENDVGVADHDDSHFTGNDSDNDQNAASLATQLNKRTYHEFATDATGTNQFETSMMRDASHRYFMAERQASNQGTQRLVGNAFSMRATSDNLPTKQESAYHLQAAQFCNTLKDSQLQTFANLMATLVPGLIGYHHRPESCYAVPSTPSTATMVGHLSSSHHATAQLFDKTHQPTSVSEIDLYYLKGKNSILENIPIPNVRLVHGHAYVSIQEIVEHFVGHGMDIDELSCCPTMISIMMPAERLKPSRNHDGQRTSVQKCGRSTKIAATVQTLKVLFR
jgi:hypothetical protein